jgi:hypothetical protein
LAITWHTFTNYSLARHTRGKRKRTHSRQMSSPP